MIILNEVAEKLEKILNGTDSETSSFTRPTDFLFRVAPQGFHLDKLSDRASGKNFIPVFIEMTEGTVEPIADLEQEDATIKISLYFPVKFKNDFFALGGFFTKVFAGRSWNYGTISGKCVSNNSVARFGELSQMALKQFKTYVTDIFQEEVDVMQPYMAMELNLYLSSIGANFLFGNDASISLTYKGTQFTPVFPESTLQSNSEVAAQQLLNATTPEISGLPTSTAYATSFAIYYKDVAPYTTILDDFFSGKSQEMEFTLTFTITTHTYTRTCYVQSINLNAEKGEPITITFTFNKKDQ